jgi:serine/threonine protein kinase
MSLQIGTSIGPYQITGTIGAGGMGEVYRARDLRLNREIAIKVLPATFSKNVDGVARFRREAQLLASLNHPNIASIYGLEESNGDLALALELVDGEDIAERLKSGPIPVDEAIGIAKQIAEGLEAAHEKGIIHRDLKPANIKLTKTGGVKILDFGLAKVFEEEMASPLESGVSQSPTIAHHKTQAGMIMGTAAYMSPEQARGKAVDKRADIWSFGVVLYEMLTGHRMFDGETVSDSLAAVLTKEANFEKIPSSTPIGVLRLLKRCLQRDPRRRLRDIADAQADLDSSVEITIPQQPASLQSSAAIRTLPWFLLAIAIAAIAAWMFFHRSNNTAVSNDVVDLDITFPPNIEPATGLQGGITLAPDGRTILLIGVKNGVRGLYIRHLDNPELTEVRDTSGVNLAAFSPDGSSAVYVPGSTQLIRISLADQQRTVLARGIDLASSVIWGRSGIIYSRAGALWMISPSGGTPKQLTVLDKSRHEVVHGDANVLTDGRTVLFSCLTSDDGAPRIEAVSIENGKRSVILDNAITPVLSPTGHLLFGRDGAVWAAPFDEKTATVRGSAIQVIPTGVVGTVRIGTVGLQLSQTGTLVYVPVDFDSNRVISVGRDGSEIALRLPLNRYGNPRLSPDGRRLLIESQGNSISTFDLARGTSALVAAAAIGTSFSTWSADGQAVVFRRFNVPYWAATDGSGKAGAVPGGMFNDFPSGPGPDSDSIIDVRIEPETSGDIFLLSMSGKFPVKKLIGTPAYEGGPQLSSDKNWLLYQSNESGQPEIYLGRYPVLDRKWQVSEGGGVQPRWNPSGAEIYYRNGHQMMAVTFDSSGAEPNFGKPTALFNDEYDYGQGISIPNYDVTRDGRFIMFRRGAHGNSIRVIINWTEQLKKIIAAGGTR